MGELTNENATAHQIEHIVKKWSHEEKVSIALFAAELFLPYCKIKVVETKRAIKLVGDWLVDPTTENKEKCKEAADNVFTKKHHMGDGFSVSNAAEHAARSVYSNSDYVATNAVMSAIAYSLEYGVDVGGVEQKIIDYINSRGE